MVDRLTELRENIYRALNTRDYSAAQAGIEQLTELEPAEGLGLLTAMYIEQGDALGAEQALARLAAERDDAYTEFLRARILFMQHRYVSARDRLLALLAAGELAPAVGEKVYNLLGQCHRELGEAADAVAAYRRAAEVAPTSELKSCEYSNYLFNSHYVRSELVEQRRAAAEVNEIFAAIKHLEHDMARHLAHKKIRIGYIAPELREHVVLCFVYAFFAAYDSEQFEVYAYANNVEDNYSAHLRTRVTGWRNILGVPAAQVAGEIVADEIDILVDFAGHEQGNVVSVLAYKPAPIIISGIGYFASTGLAAVDYFLSDKYLAAAGAQAGFTERLLVLPHSHFCYTPLRDAASLRAAEPPCVQNGYITLGSFNNFTKVNHEVLATWRQIMTALPTAHLLLKASVFNYPESQEYALQRLAAAGLDMARVECRPVTRDYLGEYADVDIALDTFPYPGGGTTCDALYMGVPVVTLVGASQGERFGGSLLTNIGLGELVATTVDEYTSRVVALAGDTEALTLLRRSIPAMLENSPVMDEQNYMREMEAAYTRLWQECSDEACRGEGLRIAAFNYYQRGELEIALALTRRLCAAYPDDEQMLYIMASSYEQLGDLPQALALCEDYFAGAPENVAIRRNFGYLRAFIAFKMGDRRAPEFYLACYEETRDPDYYSSFLMAHNSIDIAEDELYRYHTRYNEIAKVAETYQHPRARHEHRRLRVGYISPDYRLHVMFHFYMTFITHVDRDRFEVYTYSLTKKPDDYTKIVAAMSEHFVDLSAMTAADAAAAIYADEIDILVDLAGHTANGALPTLAYKPAPVQVSGLGYMATTGLSAVDYFLTDGYVDPPGLNERYFTERLLRLTSQFCYTQQAAPEPAGAPVQSRGYVTFGVFNAYRKITDEMLGAWRVILSRVPHSRLLVKNQVQFAPAMVEHIYKRFTAAGLPMDRVDFEPATVEYMTRYLDVDIALDTFPYPGGGTTCDALYMGVPVVTRYSGRHSTRFAYSILANVGVPELAATSVAEYVERAVALASDTDLLDILHKNLHTMLKSSPVMDELGYMQEVEAQYMSIWEKYKGQW